MEETVLDVLMFLFDNYLNAEVELIGDEEEIADELEQAGFQEIHVTKALDWLGDLSELYKGGYELALRYNSTRILTKQEKAKLDIKSQGYLLELQEQGVLDPPTLEIILESAMTIDVQILTLDRFKRIIALVLLNNPNAEAIVASGEDLVYQDVGGYPH